MALQTVGGQSLYYPARPPITQLTFLSGLIDATGEMFAWCGAVWNKDRATKSIHKVGFRFGAVTKAGGSALTVSLQDVSLTAGPPIQPDGTQDQTVAIANADAAFVANTWIQTAAFSADRSVTFGELVAVVVEYDGAGRLASDLVNITNLTASFYGQGTPHIPGCALKTGGTWATQSGVPNIILEFSDGTFGTLQGGYPLSANNLLSFKQDTAGSDEYALEFQVPWPCSVDGIWCVGGAAANTNNFSFILYSGTSAMTNGTIAVDANLLSATASDSYYELPFSAPISLAANTLYRLAMQPTQTTGNVRLETIDVSAANHFQAHDGGPTLCLGSRIDSGAWAAATTTRRPLMGLRISALDDGVQLGALLLNSGMTGGIRG